MVRRMENRTMETSKQASVRIDDDGNDLDYPGVTWSSYTVEPFTRECECEGPECDPDTCPRLSDTCEECGQAFSSGWVCMDGGETVCDDCVTVVEIPEGGAS